MPARGIEVDPRSFTPLRSVQDDKLAVILSASEESPAFVYQTPPSSSRGFIPTLHYRLELSVPFLIPLHNLSCRHWQAAHSRCLLRKRNG